MNVETGKIDLTSKVDGNIEDLFHLQDKLSRKIIFTLKGSISNDEERLLDDRPTTNLEAYKNFSKAIQQIYRKDESNALAFLDKAVNLDPLYNEAQEEYENLVVKFESNEIYKQALTNAVNSNRAIRKALEHSNRIRNLLKQSISTYLSEGPKVFLRYKPESVEDKINIKIFASFYTPNSVLAPLNTIASEYPPSLVKKKKNSYELVIRGGGCDGTYDKLSYKEKLEYLKNGDCFFNTQLRGDKWYPLYRMFHPMMNGVYTLYKYYFVLKIYDKNNTDVSNKYLGKIHRSTGDCFSFNYNNEFIVSYTWIKWPFGQSYDCYHTNRINITENIIFNYTIKNIPINEIRDIDNINEFSGFVLR